MYHLIFRHTPISGPCSDVTVSTFESREDLMEVVSNPRARSGLFYSTFHVPYIDHPHGLRERIFLGANQSS